MLQCMSIEKSFCTSSKESAVAHFVEGRVPTATIYLAYLAFRRRIPLTGPSAKCHASPMAHSSIASIATFANAPGFGLLGLTLSLLVASQANAQFASLQRQDGATQVSVDFGFVQYDAGSAELDLLRSDLYAEFALGVFGGYVTLPITTTLDEADDESGVGNLEFGAVFTYSNSQDAKGFQLVNHVGIAVPTGDDDLAGLIVNLLGAAGRALDTYPSGLRDTTTVRIGTSPRLGVGIVDLRADLGLDFMFIENIEDEVIIHVGLGAAVNLGLAAFSAEFVHVEFLTESNVDTQTASVGLTLDIGIFEPSIHYTADLSDFGNVSAVTLGLALVF